MKHVFAICVGLQDPMVPKDHRGGPFNVLEIQTDSLNFAASPDLEAHGLKAGPVITALDAAMDQGQAFDAVCLLYAPGSRPVEVSELARLTGLVIQSRYPGVRAYDVKLEMRTVDFPPGSDEDAEPLESLLPLAVADWAACLRGIPTVLNHLMKSQGFDLSVILGPGTPQMNAGLLEYARSTPGTGLFQIYHPNPGRASEGQNRDLLRPIALPELEAASPLGRRLQETRKALAAKTAELEALRASSEVLAEAPTSVSGHLRLGDFVSSGQTWQSLSENEKRSLLAQGQVEGMSPQELAPLLGISDKSVRNALGKFNLPKVAGKPGRKRTSAIPDPESGEGE